MHVSFTGLHKARHRLRDERGFTLIELLLATAAGLVVCAAAFAIVVSSLHFSANDAERVDSDQQGSVAMDKIVQALNSSCVLGAGVSPVVGVTGTSGATGSTTAPPSSDNSITFYSSLTDAPAMSNPNEVRIYLSSTNGPLDMATYPWVATGSTGSYAATPSSTLVLIPHAAPPGSTSTQTSTTPIFTYYGYDPTAGTLSDQYSSNPSLGATNAATTAEVGVDFESQPSDGNDPAHGSVDLSDAVVLRLSAVSNYPDPNTGSTGISPCA
ncbi:MAG TPA: prepilin-type N-terminal cleavage/methylation domain-containing protein [Solirubrobacteraceae bacterium]|jgi:prepilin-type N-terminal cleavage/methylation domain-containing protein|nr:prepilin-type N-terminal cleavage/methylation domain-containing protein [Solirubrobacteraceae bacterium]